MVRETMSAKPTRTVEEVQAELTKASKKYKWYLVDNAGMDEDEAIEFSQRKIAKALKMEAADVVNLPQHVQKCWHLHRELHECKKAEKVKFSNNLLNLAESAMLRLSCQQFATRRYSVTIAEHPERYNTEPVLVYNGSIDRSISPTPPTTSDDSGSEKRTVVESRCIAKNNQFREGAEHEGQVAQLVRNQFGFIVAESTESKFEGLKQKIFFDIKSAPANVCVGDTVKFTTHYNNGHLTAQAVTKVHDDPVQTFSGKVCKVKAQNNYGFILHEDGQDLFFMVGSVDLSGVLANGQENAYCMRVGDEVTYQVEQDQAHAGKCRAVNVALVKLAPAEPAPIRQAPAPQRQRFNRHARAGSSHGHRGQYGTGSSNHRASVDNNWRRGGQARS